MYIYFARCDPMTMSLAWGNYLLSLQKLTFKLPIYPQQIYQLIQASIDKRAKTQCSLFSFALKKKVGIKETTF